MLLFVCSGNTCRSPLAVAAWQYLRRQDAPLPATTRFEAASAGIHAAAGQPASAATRQVATEWGIDLSTHRSRQVTRHMLDEAHLVLVMDHFQRDFIEEVYEFPAERIHMLGEFAPESSEPDLQQVRRLLGEAGLRAVDSAIADPFGGSPEAYRECGKVILSAVTGLAGYLESDECGMMSDE